MTTPLRLQGTDGIRGPISQEIGNPVSTFLNQGFLTTGFFELYGYSFALLLIEQQLAEPGDGVLVGWDGRDLEGKFDQAFCSGVRKAGLAVHMMGRIPTPAVPLFMMHQGLRASAMLTASHNPADQHGIKLFLPNLGMKFLPADDELLTAKIFSLQEHDLSALPESGALINVQAKGKEFFVSQSLDPKNSWIGSDDLDLSSTLLVVDASNGAAAEVAEEIFGGLGFFDLKLTNMVGNINEHAGVADIEGQEEISAADLEGRFHGYAFLEEFFEQAKRPEVIAGQVHLVGLVFDGDADRCYRIDYHVLSRLGLVSSGDLLGYQLARVLPGRSETTTPTFAFTVESDLNLSQAAKALGYHPELCGVGDKWLLRHASASLVRSQGEGSHPEFVDLANRWLAEDNPSALQLCLEFERLLTQKPWQCPADLDFALGLEESGHALSPFWVAGTGETLIGFAGNGIKAGLNSLAAFVPPFVASELQEPFAQGVKQTFYVYYVDQGKLAPGHPFRHQLTEDLLFQIQTLGEGLTGRIHDFSEEPSLLFCHLHKGQEDYGAVFIRNSGTENKSAVYLRGPKEAKGVLDQLADHLHLYLLKLLKNPADPLAQLEASLLRCIDAGQDPLKLESQGPVKRVLKEMELKQGLIHREKGQLAIAQKGQALLYKP